MRIFIKILKFVKPYWGHLTGSMICMVIYALLSGISIWVAIPFIKAIFYPEKAVVQEVQSEQSQSQKVFSLNSFKQEIKQKTERLVFGQTGSETLKRLCITLLFAIIFKNIFGYGHAYLMTRVEEGVSKDLRELLYERFQSLPLTYFKENQAGTLISRVTYDVGVFNRSIRVIFTNLSRDPLLVLFYLVIVIILDWKLTLLALSIVPISIWVIVKIGLKLRKYSNRAQERMAEITSVLQETVFGIRIIKAFCAENFEAQKFRAKTRNYFKTAMKRIRVGRLASPVTEILGTMIGLVVLTYGGQQVLKGDLLAPEEFIIFLVALFSMVSPFTNIAKANNRIQEGLAAGKRIFDVLELKPSINNGSGTLRPKKIKGTINFKEVWFEYESGKPVLRNINLTINPGETIAIVGPTGSGKSTLVDLIPRFYDPSYGNVLIDDIDIRKMELSYVRSLVGIVTQETILFNDSIYKNIAYGWANVQKERVIQSAKIANAHEFILKFPDGYQSVIGDRGVRLSGGERQRLAIARAIFKNSPVLILDEATSSLDAKSEALVKQAIERLMQGKTSIIVAHRFSTVHNADRIIVMNEGEIVQEGKHQDLINQKGLYQKLYRTQLQA